MLCLCLREEIIGEEEFVLLYESIQGRVVRKPFNVNPGLNVTQGIIFSCLKMFFASNVWCNLRLLQLKTEGQKI